MTGIRLESCQLAATQRFHRVCYQPNKGSLPASAETRSKETGFRDRRFLYGITTSVGKSQPLKPTLD